MESSCGTCNAPSTSSIHVNGKSNYCSAKCLGSATHTVVVKDLQHDSVRLELNNLLLPNTNYVKHRVLVDGTERHNDTSTVVHLRGFTPMKTYTITYVSQRWEMKSPGLEHPGAWISYSCCSHCGAVGNTGCQVFPHTWLSTVRHPTTSKFKWSCCNKDACANSECQVKAPIRVNLPEETRAIFTITTIAAPVAQRPLDNTQQNLNELVKWAHNFIPEYRAELFLTTVNILFFGAAGSGKTSTLQALATAGSQSGELRNVGEIASGMAHVTQVYTKIKFETFGLPGPGQFNDTFGLDADNYKNDEISLMMDGKLPFSWSRSKPALNNDQTLWQGASFCDAVHVALFVFPATQARNLAQAQAYVETNNAVRFFDQARARGIPIIVVITKVDMLDSNVKNDPSLIAISEIVLATRRIVAEATKVQPANVVAIKNYIDETSPELGIDVQAMTLLNRIYSAANDYYMRVKNAMDGGELIKWAPVGPSVHSRQQEQNHLQQREQLTYSLSSTDDTENSVTNKRTAARLRSLPCTPEVLELMNLMDDDDLGELHRTKAMGTDSLFIALLKHALQPKTR